MQSIQSPLLRHLVLYYGALTIQLRPITLRRPASLLNLLWNLTITVYFYRALTATMFSHEHLNITPAQLQRIQSGKPLVQCLHTFSHIGFPIILGCNLTYFYLISAFSRTKLVELLDSFTCIRGHHRSSRTIWCILLVDYSIYLLIQSQLSQKIFSHILTQPTLARFGQFITLFIGYYVFQSSTKIIIGIFQYYKYATLLEIDALIADEECTRNLFQIQTQLRNLTATNVQLNSLLSFPLLVSIINFTFNFILIFSAFFVGVQFSSWLFILLEAIDFASISLLDHLISQKLRHLQAKLKNLTYNRGISSQQQQGEHIKVVQIVDIYGPYYATRLYNVAVIDGTFWFTTMAFIVHNVVLVTQTNA